LVVGYVPPIHIVHLLSRKIHVAIFTCMRWCKISMALITKFACRLVCGYNSNRNIGSMLHIAQCLSTMPKAGRHDESIFHSAQTINVHSHSWSKINVLMANWFTTFFSQPIDCKFIFRMGTLHQWKGQRQR